MVSLCFLLQYLVILLTNLSILGKVNYFLSCYYIVRPYSTFHFLHVLFVLIVFHILRPTCVIFSKRFAYLTCLAWFTCLTCVSCLSCLTCLLCCICLSFFLVFLFCCVLHVWRDLFGLRILLVEYFLTDMFHLSYRDS